MGWAQLIPVGVLVAVIVAIVFFFVWEAGYDRGWDQASNLWRRWHEEEERKTKDAERRLANADGRANVAESKIDRVLEILEE